MNLDQDKALIVAGVLGTLLTANIGGIIAFVISIKVSIAEMKVKIDRFEKDINNLGDKIRELKSEGRRYG